MSKQLGPVAYLAQTFPDLPTIYREIIALRSKGIDVISFATWSKKNFSDEAKDLIAQTFYIFPIRWVAFFKAHLKYLVAKPAKYLDTLWVVLTRPNHTLKKRLRILFHFAEGVYLAVEIEKQKIQHIHAHFANITTTQALIVNRLTGVPFSFTAHATDIFADQIILKEKIEAARFVVTISQYNKRFLAKFVDDDPQLTQKIHVIHSGVPTDNFDVERNPSPAAPLIVAVARLVEKKGFPLLIQACAYLRDQGYHFRCVIIGTGPQEALLRNMIKELNLNSENVELLGWQNQDVIKDYLQKATMFALPCIVTSNGDRDGIPAALMEAMAMGIPCISTSVSGIPELIEDGRTGLIVPEKDAQALYWVACLIIPNLPLI